MKADLSCSLIYGHQVIKLHLIIFGRACGEAHFLLGISFVLLVSIFVTTNRYLS